MTATLPRVDEHEVTVSAPTEEVWRLLTASFTHRSRRVGRVLARSLGAEPHEDGGKPPAVGATVPGFRVAEAAPPDRLALTGGHRFSTYALTFDLEQDGGDTRLRATTDARFPGPRGRLYRALVIGSGTHRLLVRRMLRDVRDAAEHRARERSRR